MVTMGTRRCQTSNGGVGNGLVFFVFASFDVFGVVRHFFDFLFPFSFSFHLFHLFQVLSCWICDNAGIFWAVLVVYRMDNSY